MWRSLDSEDEKCSKRGPDGVTSNHSKLLSDFTTKKKYQSAKIMQNSLETHSKGFDKFPKHKVKMLLYPKNSSELKQD